MATKADSYTVRDHFENRDLAVKSTYDRMLQAAKKLGPVREEAKKTSIHWVRKTAFAGVAMRKSGLVLTLKSDHDVKDTRVFKSEQVSAHRWHFDIKLESPEQIDRQLIGWLEKAYEISG